VDAEIRLSEAQAELGQARDHAAETEARLRRGDRTLASTEVLTARIDIERTEAAVKAAEGEVTRAQRGLRVDLEDAQLAGALAEYVSAVLDVPAEAAVAAPQEAAQSLPYVVAVQTRPNGYDASTGSYSGSCEVFYVRTEKHVAMDGHRLALALEDAGVGLKSADPNLTRANAVPVGDAVADALRLDVLDATPYASLPIITAEVGTLMVASLKGIGAAISREVHHRGEGIDMTRYGYTPPVVIQGDPIPTGTVYYGKAGGQVASDRPGPFARVDGITKDDGIRTVLGSFGCYLSGKLYRASELAKVADTVISQTVLGRCHGALGKVESVTFTGSQRVERAAIFAEFKVVSRSLTA
jgi:hypothetical protein